MVATILTASRVRRSGVKYRAHRRERRRGPRHGCVASTLSRYEEADQPYADALAVFGKTLSRSLDIILIPLNKVVALFRIH
jgi:hypothetical protein